MRIEIKLNATDYIIEVDDKCYQPMKLGINKDGKPKEETIGYYKNLATAGLRLVREEIASSPDTVSLKEFCNRVQKLNRELAEQLEAVSV